MSEAEKRLGAVIYTDGSARPNPGFYGSGMHGYVYMYPDGKNPVTRMGSWVPTNRGYFLQKEMEVVGGTHIKIVNYLDSFCSYEFEGTNNVAEINAVTLFFEKFPEVVEKIDEITFMMDSKYVMEGLSKWIYGWMRNGWKNSQGQAVKNQGEFTRAHEHLEAFRHRGKVNFIWVRGHNGEFGNTKADHMAGLGTNHSIGGVVRDFVKVSDPLRYHKVDVDIHPLLGLTRIYFSTDPESKVEGTYLQTGAPDVIGKRTADATFSVVKLDTPDPVIESIYDAQGSVPRDYDAIMYLKLARVKHPDNFPYLRDFGQYCMYRDGRNMNLNFLDGKPMTFQILDGELPLRTVDVFTHLESILLNFKENYLIKGEMFAGETPYNVHNVTDHFYDYAKKKSGKTEIDIAVLKKSFGVGVKSTSVVVQEDLKGTGEVKGVPLPLMFADDIPERNTMKKLEECSPKVFLITWREAKHLLRYSTVIQTSDAVGIWCNYFANQLLI